MEPMNSRWSIRERVKAILDGRRPDRLPFIDRLEIWYRSRIRTGTLPAEIKGMSLSEIHTSLRMGQQKFLAPYALKLHGVEVAYAFEGEAIRREKDPVLELFPAQGYPKCLALDKPGITTMEFITPVGRVSTAYEVHEQMFSMGIVPYLKEHLIKEEADYRTVEYMLERIEYVPKYDTILGEEARLGDIGYIVPEINRIPFQQMLLEYLGEMKLFYELYDNPAHVERLMAVLDQLMMEIIHNLAESPLGYVEFGDNLHGLITNPRLFEKFCLPYYQRYAEIIHGPGKKIGSHTDGDMAPLLSLLAESGLDVCESFAPAPLTQCEFEEAWKIWRNGPIIWGGIPSPILEERTPQGVFQEYIQRLLETIGSRPIILGVSDMVVGINLIERVRYIADRVEEHVLA